MTYLLHNMFIDVMGSRRNVTRLLWKKSADIYDKPLKKNRRNEITY